MPVVSTAVDQDQLAIMERMSRYAWGYDSTDVEMLRDSFTSDASFSMHLEGASEWGPYRGRDLIVEWMAGVKKTQTDQRRHCISNFVFDEITSTQARIRCFLLVTAAENNHVRFVTTGWYRLELSKQVTNWRIRKLELYLDAPY
jgi:hypothetical protein